MKCRRQNKCNIKTENFKGGGGLEENTVGKGENAGYQDRTHIHGFNSIRLGL